MALLFGAALLGLHFLASAFSQMPLTPVKLRYYHYAADYLGPYFSQNWMLFAPDPLSDNRGILARVMCSDGSTTGFYDVTTKYVEKAQQSRFFPSRMSRLVTGSVQQINGSDPVLMRLRESEKEKKKPELPLTPYEKTSQKEAVRFLSRYSLSQIPHACGGGAPEKIQIRMYVQQLPPWSKRHDPKAEDKVDVQDMEWLKAAEL
ncbi:DUF5819 family protein [Streptomyces sp. UNOC14_S4]|uniref:DUF5819 family protein n=1 Tax=Streptomyces sp. UNOC14_S4 TaxID=2872340 RepID=UPI001E40A2A1|nr:DUF5819 family protein [Streptomyces sp. UNOC14_S4]MCC3768924.1 hypothetical protein [Streptomyces sp. UNOC14_S4]